jgi:hypothetical protein
MGHTYHTQEEYTMAKPGTVAVRNPDYLAWVDQLLLEADVTSENNDFDPADILGRMMTAATFEEVLELQDSSLPSGKDLVNIPHTISDFRLRRSDDKYAQQNADTLPVYAIIEATRDNGERLVYGCGARNVVAIVWQARIFNRLPFRATLTARSTPNGDLLSLKPVS